MKAAASEPAASLLAAEDLAFDDLPAAGRPLARLAAAHARGRLAHAIVLAGPAGAGKRHCAVRLAQLLVCERAGAGAAAPCLRCAACDRVPRGLDPDVVVLEPAFDAKRQQWRGEIVIEQVRDLQRRLSFRTAGKRRVALVDPADRLSPVAQEALLKTLEEPPDGALLVLITSRPSALKPTVRSRCQLVRVQPPSPQDVTDLLIARGRSKEEAARAARLSGGSLRDALAIDCEAASGAYVALARLLYEVMGPKGEPRSRDVALDVVPRKADEEPAEGGRRDALGEWLAMLERVLRDVLVAGVDARAGAPPLEERLAFPEAAKAATTLASRLPPARAARALEDVARAREDLALHLSARVVVTDLLLRLHGLRAGAPQDLSTLE